MQMLSLWKRVWCQHWLMIISTHPHSIATQALTVKLLISKEFIHEMKFNVIHDQTTQFSTSKKPGHWLKIMHLNIFYRDKTINFPSCITKSSDPWCKFSKNVNILANCHQSLNRPSFWRTESHKQLKCHMFLASTEVVEVQSEPNTTWDCRLATCSWLATKQIGR